MQKSLSLEVIKTPVAKTQEWEGWLVPWEVRTFEEDFRRAETTGGVFDLSMYSVVAIHGKDARDYLQRMSTVNFKTWSPSQIVPGGFLTGRGQVVVLGQFLEKDEKFLFLTTPGQKDRAMEHIEKFHFAEAFQVEDVSAEYGLVATWGDFQPPAGAISWKDARRSMVWHLASRAEAAKYLAACGDGLLGQHLFELYRVKAGLPDVGREISDREIILEGGLDDYVARNKGCYPGQEVVERIYTYGQVNKKLLPVEITSENSEFPAPPFAITSDDKNVGNVVALERFPGNVNKAAGLAYLNKAFWSESRPLAAGNGVLVRITERSR